MRNWTTIDYITTLTDPGGAILWWYFSYPIGDDVPDACWQACQVNDGLHGWLTPLALLDRTESSLKLFYEWTIPIGSEARLLTWPIPTQDPPVNPMRLPQTSTVLFVP